MSSLDYFNPKRTQPFIITLFMVIMAFKRVCKLMKMRMQLVKKRTHSHQLSLMQRQLKRSNRDVIEAARGRDVIQSTFVQNKIIAERNPQPINTATNEPKPIRKISTQKKVRRYLDDYAVKCRLGKGAPATVDRLVKALVVPDGPNARHHGGKQGAVRKSAMIMSALKATTEARAAEIARGPADRPGSPTAHHSHHSRHRHQQSEEAKAIEEEEAAGGVEDELGYEAGTHIYFGATVALQARHGGFLSYSSSAIRASAHKVLNNSRFIVKNSDDHTDSGVMRYGAALWLQAGHHDVLGAQYGSLIDQKREIQPALVSCKRASMFKAQQYGRWIVLNRARPMETIGQPVLHEDKIILEQEWFFLASSSPYESHMYKTLNNSEEALTTKTELFNPGEECSWKMHLVALPSEDKAGELQRQLLLQQAKESIDDSAALRYEKAPSLLTSLHSRLPEELTDQAIFHGSMRRKTHAIENQEYLMDKYKQLGAKNFHSNYNPTKFLGHVYGRDSNIVKYKTFVLKRNENDLTSSLYEQASQSVYDPSRYDLSAAEGKDPAPRNPIELAEDAYWVNAQKVLLDTKSWVELHSSMKQYYQVDRVKKIRAASVLQKWIRRFLMNSFNFERKMKLIDQNARNKLQEKLIARRKALIEHVSAMDASDYIDKVGNLKFSASSTMGSVSAPHPSKARPRPGGINSSVSSLLSQSMSSVPPLSRSNTAIRSGSLDIHGAAHAAAVAMASAAANAVSGAAPVGSATGPLPYSVDDRRRSKSLTPAQRSKSLAQLNDISQIVGPAAMTAIFNAAGLVPAALTAQEPGSATAVARLGRSQSMIFQHTAVGTVEEGDGEGSPLSPSSPTGGSGRNQRATLLALHAQARSMPSLPTMGEGRASFSAPSSPFVQRHGGGGSVVGGGGSSKMHRSDSFAEKCEAERIEKRNAFTAMLGFEVPGAGTSPTNSAKNRHGGRVVVSSHGRGAHDERTADPESPGSPQSSPPTSPGPCTEQPCGGIAYQTGASPEQANRKGVPEEDESQRRRHRKEPRQGQRPYTANAALRTAPSMAEELEKEARQREREQHEAHKAAQKELLRAQARQERKRLGRTADNEFGLPKDMFRNTQADCSAVIGLKFLRAVSKNPKIYDDVKLKKRPSSSAGHRSHPRSASAVRAPGSSMW